tara:strand:- start:3763 stop:4095 length:333 start_codon:yes stop_codon:yes gene_type:complete
MSSIYIHIENWKIKSLQVFSTIGIISCTTTLVITVGRNNVEIILLLFSIILGLIPYALNPKDHLRTLLAPMKKIEENIDTYYGSIKKSDHLLRDISLCFFFLWLIAILVY